MFLFIKWCNNKNKKKNQILIVIVIERQKCWCQTPISCMNTADSLFMTMQFIAKQ